MLSREDRILSEILVSRGLVARERIEACASDRRGSCSSRSLVDALVDSGDVARAEAQEAAEEARALDEALAPELPAGMKLGEFKLIREIGRGGMGIVYEAEQESLGRRVALKVLPAGAALDERLAIRFLREARAAGRLRHPGIVSVYTSGRAEGVLYFAMELVDGRTLASRIAGGPLEAEEAARIAAEVARGLAYAHAEGLVHRDVKPENILLSTDGRTMIADFGLVQEASAGSFTLSRHVLGTPAFISPEQVKGESVDSRSDVYGLGAVLYAMLSGSPPYTGEVPSLVLARALTERPPALLSVRPGLPRRLVAICERAMAAAPAERYASADLMAEDLEEFLRAPSAIQAASPSKRARIVGAVVAAAIMVALGLVASLSRGRSATTPLAASSGGARFQALPHTAGRKVSPSLSPDGTQLAYSSDADGDWDIYLLDLASGDLVNLTADAPSEDLSPAFSPDGNSIAFASYRPVRGIWIIDLPAGTARKVVEQPASALAWSADGLEILFTDRAYDGPGASAEATKLFAVEVASGRSRALTGIYGSQVQSSRAGPLAFVGQGGGRTDLWTIAEAGGGATRVTDDDALEWSPVWSSAGTAIYFGGDRGGTGGLFRIPVDRASGRPTGEILPVSRAIFPAPFYLTQGGTQTDSLALISTGHEGRLYRLMLTSAAEPSVDRIVAIPDRYIAAVSPDLSRDGHRLVFSASTSEEDLAIGDPEGSDPRLLTQDAFHDRAPRWSPDGTRIAFHSDRSGKMEIWTIRSDGSDAVQRTAMRGEATQPVWSPDGSRIAFTVPGEGAFLIDAEWSAGEGEPEPMALADDGGPFEPSSWSPDGRLLAGSARGIVVYSPDSRRYRRLTDSGRFPVWLDARRLVFSAEREIHLLDSRSGDSRVLFSFAPARVSPSLSVTPEGRSIYVSLSVSPEEVWRVALTE